MTAVMVRYYFDGRSTDVALVDGDNELHERLSRYKAVADQLKVGVPIKMSRSEIEAVANIMTPWDTIRASILRTRTPDAIVARANHSFFFHLTDASTFIATGTPAEVAAQSIDHAFVLLQYYVNESDDDESIVEPRYLLLQSWTNNYSIEQWLQYVRSDATRHELGEMTRTYGANGYISSNIVSDFRSPIVGGSDRFNELMLSLSVVCQARVFTEEVAAQLRSLVSVECPKRIGTPLDINARDGRTVLSYGVIFFESQWTNKSVSEKYTAAMALTESNHDLS